MIADRLDRRAVLTGVTLAALTFAATPAFADSGAAAPIQRLSAALGEAGRPAAFEQRVSALAPAVDRAFDLAAVLRESVGPRWEQLSPEDRTKLSQAFLRYTAANYVANLAGKAPEVSQQTRALPNGDQVVDTDAAGTKVSYVMHRTPSGWKAVDVLGDGSISRVAAQRSDFRAMLDQGGGPALAASLERKANDLAG